MIRSRRSAALIANGRRAFVRVAQETEIGQTLGKTIEGAEAAAAGARIGIGFGRAIGIFAVIARCGVIGVADAWSTAVNAVRLSRTDAVGELDRVAIAM